MIHLVCLTKSYNLNDFKIWYNWHNSLGVDYIHIFDNESTVDIKSLICSKDSYDYISGWPNQWQLYNDILNNNIYNLKWDDIIIFLDDDEFLWTDQKLSLEQTIRSNLKQLNCILMPQILMSTKEITLQRSTDLIQHSIYRRNDLANQGKSIIFFDPNAEYDFTKEVQNEKGHVPFINGVRYSDVVGSDCSKTTYGLVDYNANLRLYHYHIKSLDDWNKKIKRGSAACEQQFYNEDVTKNIHYGNYNVIDLSMLNLKKLLK